MKQSAAAAAKKAKSVSSGAKARSDQMLYVGAKAPTPGQLPFPTSDETNATFQPLLLNSDLLDQAQHVGFGDVVERSLVFFLEAFAQIFGGDEAGFAVGQIPAGALAKFHESGVRQPEDNGPAIDEKFRVDGIGVARGDAVPHVRKAAVVDDVSEFGWDVERADECAHRADIGDRG